MLGAPTAPDKAAGTWLHMNPQRLDLGRVGLLLRPQHDGEPERNPAVLEDVHQRLRLWSGIIDSSFKYAGERVRVVTAAHPERAAVAFRIESALLTSGRLGVSVAFPYASATFNLTADWDAVDRHRTDVETCDHSARAMRTLDGMTYTVDLLWNAATLVVAAEPHHLELVAHANRLDLVVTYSEGGTDVTPATVDDVVDAAAGWWEAFWLHGAAVDFSRCSDPRAAELERRVVLSQYLTVVHCAGSAPPQETGLVTNSSGGKFHLEMHWWHAAHFVQWGRPELLRHSLSWYEVILPVAQATARRQGYEGARWPKQVGPDGRESPGEIGPFLVWQQPHLLYFAELLHAADPTSAVLDEFAEIVAQTATFMASFVEQRDDAAYHLAPPLLPAQEFYDRRTTEDPTFELAYWWWGLEIAERWRERRGMTRDAGWSDVQTRLARPHQRDGRYTAVASEPYLVRNDHPSLIGALGVVPPTPLIDAEVMRATLDDVLADWEWSSAWGWDFPMLAMTATRLGESHTAVDALLNDHPKNRYLVNGHNPQMGNLLPVYLPGNGALLAAVSLMIAGSHDSTRPTPGFPDDGTWDLHHEGFLPWP